LVDPQVLRLGILVRVSGSGDSREGAEGDEEVRLPLFCLHIHILMRSSSCEYNNNVLYTA